MSFLRSLDNLIEGSRNLLIRQTGSPTVVQALKDRAALDIARTQEAVGRLGQGIKVAARNVGDDITYAAANIGKAPPRRMDYYEDTPLDYVEWRTIQNLGNSGYDPRQLAYLNQRARQSPGVLLDDSRMAEELLHIDGDTFNAVRQARNAAIEEYRAGQRNYDPSFRSDKQNSALERFLGRSEEPDGYSPEDQALYAALKQRRNAGVTEPLPVASATRIVPDDYVNYFQF